MTIYSISNWIKLPQMAIHNPFLIEELAPTMLIYVKLPNNQQ